MSLGLFWQQSYHQKEQLRNNAQAQPGFVKLLTRTVQVPDRAGGGY